MSYARASNKLLTIPASVLQAIDKPNFIPQKQADNWLGRNEPVIVVSINPETKAYL